LLGVYTQQKNESFLAYFMHIINSCVVKQDSILQTGVCARRSSRTPMLDCARIQRDMSAAWFCSCKLLWCSDECVLIPCFILTGSLMIFLQLWTAVP